MTRLYDTTSRIIRSLSGSAPLADTSGLTALAAAAEMSGFQNSTAFVDILKTLIRAPSVVGSEYSFFRVLRRELEERGAKVTLYEGLLVAQGERPDGLMVSAHIDRHGLVCTGPNEFQYAAFVAGSRSDLLGNSVSEELMNTVADRFNGMDVYAYEPWSGAYIGGGQVGEVRICPHRHNLNFEVRGLEYLMPGTPIAFRDHLRIEGGYYSAQLDNVLSAAVLVHLFERSFDGTAFFTAQEEAGRSWRYLLEWFRRFGNTTNQLVVIDTSPYRTKDEADQQDIVLRGRDANAGFNAGLTAQIEDIAKANGIRYTYKDRFVDAENRKLEAAGQKPRSIGSTELGRIIAASNGLVEGTTIQIPTTGYHTTSETASVAACAVFIELLCALGSRKLQS